MPEVSDADLATYQRGLALLRKMESDPTAKGHFEKAIKAVVPEVRTEAETLEANIKPHLEPVTAALTKIQESLDAQEAARVATADREVENHLNSRFAAFKEQGLTDDGEMAIKKLMVDRSIADPDAAHALFMQQNPKPTTEAPAWQPDGWDISSTAKESGLRDMEGLFKDETKWGDQEAAIALNEIRLAKAA